MSRHRTFEVSAEALFSGVSKYLENINSVVAARPDKSASPE